ncbi:MAG TPA: ribonuclease HII [Syntrophomonadaceae bacterium]|nr:ribonuclease HII [Syntrophomonadaceae bacterium]
MDGKLSRGKTRILDEEEYDRLKRIHLFEQKLWKNGAVLIAGVDEAGRGPLAGPVVAAAVVIKEELLLPGLNDSKLVNPALRAALSREIKRKAAGWAVGIVPVGWIEKYNIHEASILAMKKALEQLKVKPDHILIDGCWPVRDVPVPQTTIVKGDTRSAVIAAASILAKTTRDAIMSYYGLLFPKYGFEQNKGYPTPAHLEAIARYGPCFLHRRTFRGVKEMDSEHQVECSF